MARDIWIRYRNWRGEVAWRHVLPLVWDFTSSHWHGEQDEQQWLMLALVGRRFTRQASDTPKAYHHVPMCPERSERTIIEEEFLDKMRPPGPAES